MLLHTLVQKGFWTVLAWALRRRDTLSRRAGLADQRLRAARSLTALTGSIVISLGNASAAELGANKFDLALAYLQDSNASGASPYPIRLAMARKSIADARDAGWGFLRVSVTGYWPVNIGDKFNDLALWQADSAAFWATEDRMFDDLDRAGVRLVPSFVWNPTQFPALAGETLATFLRNPGSQSRRLLARFVTEFITRYRGRRTILFYELTNELNLGADLDLRRKCADPTRCALDDFTTDDMVAFSRDLVSLIKSLDRTRPVTSGYSIPRRSATHLEARPEFAPGGPDWTLDTLDEFKHYLLSVHEPFDIISVHIYPGIENDRFGRPPGQQYALVADAAEAAREAGKKLFIGEFGDAGPTPFMRNMLDAIVREKVDYASFWVWEYYQKTTYLTHDTEADRTSVEPGYSDDLVALLQSARQAMGGAPPLRDPAGPPRVVLTWPLPCAVVDRPIDLAAVASDGARGVSRVEFLVGGKQVGSAASPPYTIRFDPAGLGERIAEITARAVAASGARADFTSTVRLGGPSSACVSPEP